MSAQGYVLLNEYIGTTNLMTGITPTIPMGILYVRLNTAATEEQTFILANGSEGHESYTIQPNVITRINWVKAAYADTIQWATIPEDGDNTIEIWVSIAVTHNEINPTGSSNLVLSSSYFAEGDVYIKVDSAETSEHVFTAQPDNTTAGLVTTNELTPLVTSTSTVGFSINPALPDDAIVHLYYPNTITVTSETEE